MLLTFLSATRIARPTSHPVWVPEWEASPWPEQSGVSLQATCDISNEPVRCEPLRFEGRLLLQPTDKYAWRVMFLYLGDSDRPPPVPQSSRRLFLHTPVLLRALNQVAAHFACFLSARCHFLSTLIVIITPPFLYDFFSHSVFGMPMDRTLLHCRDHCCPQPIAFQHLAQLLACSTS